MIVIKNNFNIFNYARNYFINKLKSNINDLDKEWTNNYLN